MRKLTAVVAAALLLPLAGGVAGSPAAQAQTTQMSATAGQAWQTNGTVWALAYAGGKVYLGGSFTSVRPPGAAAGSGEVARAHLAVFDAQTGALVPEFTHGANNVVYALHTSSDGSRLYLGGTFSSVDGQPRPGVGAVDLSTSAGTLSRFAPALSSGARVRAIATTDSAVYVGGSFTTADSATSNAAAFEPVAGARLPWTPVVDAGVNALLVAPSQDRVFVGGSFDNVNGEHHRALATVDAVTGGTPTSGKVADGVVPIYCADGCSATSSVKSLTTDGTKVYAGNEGTKAGNFDGTLAVDGTSGALAWRDTCLGATQAVAVVGQVLYGGSHAHDCTTVKGGFPQEPLVRGWHHLTAESTGDGTMLPWFPATNDGPSGPGAVNEVGPRAMATDGTQVFVGGQFTTVNGAPQQGFTRFGTARDTTPPTRPAAPVASSSSSGQVVVRYQGVSDLDDGTLTYNLYQDGVLVDTQTDPYARFWRSRVFVYRSGTLAPGSSHSYSVEAVDADGLASGRSAARNVTIAAADTGGLPSAVAASGPGTYWRLDEPASSTSAADSSGNGHTGLYSSKVVRGQQGAWPGDSAASVAGAGLISATGAASPAPITYAMEMWFKATGSGGRLIGYGNSQTGTSTLYDRTVYLNSGGQLMFSVYSSGYKYLWSKKAYNDGDWHHVVAGQDGNGMTLYVDGARVATGTATSARAFSGWLRVGSDSVRGLPRFASSTLNGVVDEVAVYPRTLSAAEVAAHYAGTR